MINKDRDGLCAKVRRWDGTEERILGFENGRLVM